MFDDVLDELDLTGLADVLHASVRAEREVAARRMAAVAAWADQHHPDAGSAGHVLRRRPGERVGAEGTPEVTPDAIVELGVLLQCSTVAASNLLRDTLEIRHRLPQMWAAVMRLDVEVWKARKVAAATRVLTPEQAGWVDGQVVTALCDLPFGRAQAVLEGKVVAADPAGHEARRAAEQERRFVAVGRRSETGTQLLYARGAAGDMTRLLAMVNHLADCMAASGSTDTADERRAAALGLLANPAMACLVLARAHDAAESPTANDKPDPEPEPEPHVTAVHLAVEMGRLLAGLGSKVWDRLRPRTVLYVHLHQDAVTGLGATKPGDVARVEDHGAVSLEQLKDWLGDDRVTVRPVAYPLDQAAVDDYQVPRPMEEAVVLRHPFEVFPFGTLPSRRADKDHTRPYRHRRRGDPDDWSPGQTGLHNLAPLGRRHHRAKTFAGFVCHQPLPGVHYWRLPSGRWYRVDNQGTRHLGAETPRLVAELDGATEAARSPLERRVGRWVWDLAA